jgi:hypothetical protein
MYLFDNVITTQMIIQSLIVYFNRYLIFYWLDHEYVVYFYHFKIYTFFMVIEYPILFLGTIVRTLH